MNEVATILGEFSPDCRPSHVESLGSAGGMSGAQFWRLTTPRGTLCLRRWPTEHPTPVGLEFIHAVLRHAAENGCALVPVPIATTTGDTFLSHAGHVWEVAPWLPGSADYDQSPRYEKLRAAMVALAQFHNAVADFKPPAAPSAGGVQSAVVRRLAQLHDLAAGGIAELSRAVTSGTWPELGPLAREFLAALPRSIPIAVARLTPLADASLPLQPCIRDIWHDHVLFTGDTVTGLIDFGATAIDTPATDIARLLGSLESRRHARHAATAAHRIDATEKVETWRDGLAAYTAVRRLTEKEIEASAALDVAAPIVAGCNWLRWIYLDGRQFENRAQVIERFRRIVTQISG